MFPLHLIEPMAQHPLNLLFSISHQQAELRSFEGVLSPYWTVLSQCQTHPTLRNQRPGGEPRLPKPHLTWGCLCTPQSILCENKTQL